MKTSLKSLFILLFLFAGFGCDREETFIAKKGAVIFSVGHQGNQQGRSAQESVPTSIVLSIEDHQGNLIFENKKIGLLQFGEGFVSENLELGVGNYKLTRFFVLNADNKIVYAAPLRGSDKASQVNHPLRLSFNVTESAISEVVPQVLAVTASDNPELFGYASFGFEVIENPETMKVRIKVELRIGDIDYIDVDSRIFVKGYDSLNNVKWSQEFSYTGPSANDLTLKRGFHHYSFEVNQWGVNDKQTINHDYLWENRVRDNAVPVTYVLGGSSAVKKVSYYINYFEMSDTVNPGNKYWAPQYKIDHEYNASGKIQRLLHYSYSEKTNEFTLARYAEFNYSGNRVDNISHYFADDDRFFLAHTYQYFTNGNVSRISEENLGAGVNSEVNFTYNYTDRLINAAYTFSNGGSFQYEFFYDRKNIVTESTTRGAQLCSEGEYTYDKNINPLKHLGYVDYSLRNYSINNKLTEDIQYHGCGFPTLIPYAYSYEYDSQGYPVTATTHYKSGSEERRAQTRYFYQ